jgi:hypothetical protein
LTARARTDVYIGDPDAVIHMLEIDRLPKKWRALIHEYGVKLVNEALTSGLTPAEARERAEDIRAERQQQIIRLLCGPKIVAKSSFFRLLPRAEGFKTATEFGERRKIRFSV